jgi:hypothetical protein
MKDKRAKNGNPKPNKKTQDYDTRPQLSILEYIDRAKKKHISFTRKSSKENAYILGPDHEICDG